MNRNLIDYLPAILRSVREYKAILMGGEQDEMSALWDGVSDAFDDQYLNSATLNGVQRWESILGIFPRGTDGLEARKFRILARLNEQLPYTLPVLKTLLSALCGEEGYTVEVLHEEYLLTVRVLLIARSNFGDVDELLKKIVPANMIIDLSLLYVAWEIIKGYTWGHLKTKTWDDVREGMLQ